MPPKCRECGDSENVVLLIQMKIDGTANTYAREDRRYVCKTCRKKPGYRGRFRVLSRR